MRLRQCMLYHKHFAWELRREWEDPPLALCTQEHCC